MAFGKGSSRNPNRVAYSFKIKTKDLPAPVFEVSKRDEEKKEWVPVNDTVTNVSGKIVSFENKDFQYKGKLISSVNLTLEDGDDIYFITIPYTNLGRNALNSLLNLKDFETPIEIRLYQTKPKEGKDGKEAKTYPAIAIVQGEELIKWAHKLEDLPEIEKIKFKGEWQSDTTKIDEFFKNEVIAFAKTVKASVKRGTPKKESKPAQEDDEDTGPQAPDDVPDEQETGGKAKPLF